MLKDQSRGQGRSNARVKTGIGIVKLSDGSPGMLKPKLNPGKLHLDAIGTPYDEIKTEVDGVGDAVVPYRAKLVGATALPM